VPARDRRTIGELLADSDALARETLLNATLENAPAMVRSWNQLIASAAHLWAALSFPPDSMSGSDPMERLRVVGEAIGRSVCAGHWPGRGPTDDHLTEIADNLSRGAPSDRAPRPLFLARYLRPGDAYVVCRGTRDGPRTRRVCNGAAAPPRGWQPPTAANG
jgi:hypothetical protein